MTPTPFQSTPFLLIEDELIQNLPTEIQAHFKSLGGRTTKWGNRQRQGLLRMFWISFGHFHRHEDDDGFFEGMDSFSQEWIRKNISTAERIYSEIIRPYYDSSANWSQAQGRTKKFTMYPEVQNALLKTFGSDSSMEISFEDVFPERTYVISESKIFVPSLIEIDLKEMDQKIGELSRTLDEYLPTTRATWIRKNGVPGDMERERNRLLILRKTAISMIPANSVPNLYERGIGGRLYGNAVSLQFLKKETRLKLLKGRGYYDYDFELCHPTIVFCLLQHLGIKSPTLEQYLGERVRVVERLMKLTDLVKDEIKEILTVLVYDSDTASPFKRIHQICRRNEERIDRLNRDDFFSRLKNEYKEARNAIIQHFTQGKVMYNPFRRKFEGKNRSASKMSFVLQSVEAEMLEICCSPYNDTVLLCFDGWISPKREVAKLEKLVTDEMLKRTGIPFRMKIKEELVK